MLPKIGVWSADSYFEIIFGILNLEKDLLSLLIMMVVDFWIATKMVVFIWICMFYRYKCFVKLLFILGETLLVAKTNFSIPIL